MASGNREFIEGIPLFDEHGKQTQFLNVANGQIEDIKSQKMVFDPTTGKLMAVVSGDKRVNLDNRVFVEMPAAGFFIAVFTEFSIIAANVKDKTCFNENVRGKNIV
jgi:hypothetical protein